MNPHPKDSAAPLKDKSFLLKLEKPCRYIGGEVNAVYKDPQSVKCRIALVFPDVYEVGMSHLGLKILYSILNSHPDLYAERAFAPWSDMEAALRRTGEPLRTLETGAALNQMDVLGFSLQYELSVTNVLLALDLAGIPLRSERRDATHPFVIGGGPVAFNPMPLSPFFDAFVIGDGEEVILELAAAHVEWKAKSGHRHDLLEAWSAIPGVYVPGVTPAGRRVQRRILADLNNGPFPEALVTPFCEIVHDRIGLEIARGCTHGCRFCQAGMVCRPVRERHASKVLDITRANMDSTGWEEVALLSLSTGDYSQLKPLVKALIDEYAATKTSVSLPSMRTESFDAEIIDYIRKSRQTGLTLAPEAGTERLRRFINKGNTEEDLEKAVRAAFVNGQKKIKLYFMIGLPSEQQEDLDGIIGMCLKAVKWSKGGAVTASISTFVPKCHTPFQWARQMEIEETYEKQRYIKQYFQTRGKARIKFHNPRMSFLEGVFARGDAAVADVIETAYANGARFDGWDESFRFQTWMDAFAQHGIDPAGYLRERELDEELPWSFIDSGVSPEYLRDEWARALREECVGDCRSGECNACGVCDFETVAPILSEQGALETPSAPTTEAGGLRKFRLYYHKVAAMALLGHHDVTRTFQRAFKRAGLTLDHTKGFHPHPKMQFSPPCAVGVESRAEFMDFDLLGSRLTQEEIFTRLASVLPVGLTLQKVVESSLKDKGLSGKIRGITYNVRFAEEAEAFREGLLKFEAADSWEIRKERHGKTKIRDLKRSVLDLEINENGCVITMSADPDNSVHIYDTLSSILSIPRDCVADLSITKTSVIFQDAEGAGYGK